MEPENIKPTEQGEAIAIQSDPLARRRMLLKGLGKGAAVLAAAVPLKTLATQSSTCTHPGNNGAPVIRCGISGMQSGIGSRQTYTVCEGYSPGWWGQVLNDSNPRTPKRAWPTDYNEKCNVKFPKEGLNKNGVIPTLYQVMDDPSYANTDTRHWICAWLNALSGGPKGNFPYTGAEVLAFYNGTGPYTSAAALTFFKTYMETHTPPP